jgi:hypothetical protein
VRYRTRFFNRKASAFYFYPQVAKPHGYLPGGGVQNLDWDFRSNNQQDYVDKWCSLEWEPKLQDTGEKFYLAQALQTPEERQPFEQAPDVYGIAVVSNVVDPILRRASLAFMRPLAPLLEDDLALEENQTYSAYINWGIFPSESTDRDVSYVRGHKGTTANVTPYELLIKKALGGSWLRSGLLGAAGLAVILLD